MMHVYVCVYVCACVSILLCLLGPLLRLLLARRFEFGSHGDAGVRLSDGLLSDGGFLIVRLDVKDRSVEVDLGRRESLGMSCVICVNAEHTSMEDWTRSSVAPLDTDRGALIELQPRSLHRAEGRVVVHRQVSRDALHLLAKEARGVRGVR